MSRWWRPATEARRWRAGAAVHEAGHAVVFAALGLSVASAQVRKGRGWVRMGRVAPAAAPPPPPDRLAHAILGLSGIAVGLSGAFAVAHREAARPLAWRTAGRLYTRRLSAGDWHIVRNGNLRLAEAGLSALKAGDRIEAWCCVIFERHRATLGRLAGALYRRGRLSGPELAEVLAPVADDPIPFLRLRQIAAELLDDPDAALPAAADPGQPAGEEVTNEPVREIAPRIGDGGGAGRVP